MLMNLAYAEGRARAEGDFGVRTAEDSFSKGVPPGDMRLPVERLTRTLGALDSGTGQKKDERRSRFGNPVRWGNVSTPYGTGASSFDYSGIGRDGAAI